MAISWDVQWLVVTVQELDDVRWGRGVDNGGGDELVHRLMVRRV